MTDPVGRVRGKYATKVGGKHNAPSVTRIIGDMVNKPGLAPGAVKETSLFVINHQDEWIDLPHDEAYRRLMRHYQGVWSDKAARGTLVHNLAAKWAAGVEVDVPAEINGYMDALDVFWRENHPEWIEVEQSVIYDEAHHEYGGSFDAIVKMHAGPMMGETALVDFKTGRRYPAEVILQIAAYRYAKAIGVYDETGALVDTRPMPRTTTGAVLYLHDDGSYELLELPAGGDAFGAFLRLRVAWTWMQTAEAWVKKNPEKRMGLVPA